MNYNEPYIEIEPFTNFNFFKFHIQLFTFIEGFFTLAIISITYKENLILGRNFKNHLSFRRIFLNITNFHSIYSVIGKALTI
jgi:hypothetical protein